MICTFPAAEKLRIFKGNVFRFSKIEIWQYYVLKLCCTDWLPNRRTLPRQIQLQTYQKGGKSIQISNFILEASQIFSCETWRKVIWVHCVIYSYNGGKSPSPPKMSIINFTWSELQGNSRKRVWEMTSQLFVTLYTLSIYPSALCTLHSALCTLHSALCPLHSALCTLHSALCTLQDAAEELLVKLPLQLSVNTLHPHNMLAVCRCRCLSKSLGNLAERCWWKCWNIAPPQTEKCWWRCWNIAPPQTPAIPQTYALLRRGHQAAPSALLPVGTGDTKAYSSSRL